MCLQAQVRLNVHMLAQNQPLPAGKSHIEIVFRALLAAVHPIVNHAAIVLVAGGLRLNGVNDALPHALVHAGVDRDGLALVEGADVQLGDGALHAELARGKDGDKGLLLAVGVGGGGLVDLSDHALYLAENLRVVDGVLQLVDLLLLGVAVVFLRLDLQLHSLDLHGVGILLILAGFFLLVLQVVLLVLQGGDLVFNALQIQFGLVQLKLQLLCVIAEQRVPRVHLVTLCDIDFCHSFGVIFLNGIGSLGFHHAGIPGQRAQVQPGNLRHGLHIYGRSARSCPKVLQPEEPQARGSNKQRRQAA